MAVKAINKKYCEEIYHLDIFGPIEKGFEERMYSEIIESQGAIEYKGVIAPHDAIVTLEKYYMLLFPTHYYMEGFPGTFLDAFYAGLPIISSDWIYSKELLEDGKCGFIYDFNNFPALYDMLDYIYENPEEIYQMREFCRKQAERFTPDNSIRILLKNLQNSGE
jgi:glycosyltransferase involved in cell wall biosynthesis